MPADLSQLWPYISGAVTVVGLAILLWGLRGRAQPQPLYMEQLERYLPDSDSPPVPQPPPHPGQSRGDLLGRMRRRIRGDSLRITPRKATYDRTAQELLLADLDLTPVEWGTARAAAALLLALLVTLRMGVIFGAVVLVVGYLLGGRLFLSWRQSRREARFERQLTEAISVISSAIKAGHTLAQALDQVAVNVPEPAGSEFGRVAQATRLGIPLEQALENLAIRNRSRELSLLVNALNVWRQSGGNVTTILESVANTLRQRIKIKGDVRTLTAQARFSGWIIALLPFAVLAILSTISPGYMDPMFKSVLGMILLGGAGFCIAVGAVIMNRIAKVEY